MIHYPTLRSRVQIMVEPIVRMLYRTNQGIRNDTMLFLIPYLRNTMKLSYEQIEDVMVTWGSRCHPSYDEVFVRNETKRLFYNYPKMDKAKYGRYTAEMAKHFGYLDFEGQYQMAQEFIYLSNDFLENLHELKDGEFTLYLNLLLDRAFHGQRNYNQEEISQIAGINRVSFYQNIRSLVASKKVTKVRAKNKNQGEKATYYLKPEHLESHSRGFTMIPKMTLKFLLQEMGAGELKLYLFLYMQVKRHGQVFMTQERIGECIGRSQHRVSELTGILHEKGYLVKGNMYESQGIQKCVYTIH